MEKPIKFSKMSSNLFRVKCRSAYASMTDEFFDTEYDSVGTVKIPGFGTRPCLIKDGKPTHFYDSDDGWNSVPNVEFVEV